MKLKNLTILTAIFVVLFASKFCYAKMLNPFESDAFKLQMDLDDNGNPTRTTSDDTTTSNYNRTSSYDPYAGFREFSIFRIGFGFAYSTNDFVVATGEIEIGFPNMFNGFSFSLGMGEGFIASESTTEVGFFFCLTMMAKYTFDVNEIYYPGVGLKFLGGGTINFTGPSKEYETLGMMGYLRFPFFRVFVVDTSVTLELITDSTHSVGLCFDMMLGLHF